MHEQEPTPSLIEEFRESLAGVSLWNLSADSDQGAKPEPLKRHKVEALVKFLFSLVIWVYLAFLVWAVGRARRTEDNRSRRNSETALGDESFCGCFTAPSGTFPVLTVGPDFITAHCSQTSQLERSKGDTAVVSFQQGNSKLRIDWDGSLLMMAWRLHPSVNSPPHPMLKQPDGTWLCRWKFSYPTCYCGPEGIHYNRDGLAQAIYDPNQNKLAFRVLKDSTSLPIGPP